MTNWQRKSEYLLREVVKFRTYIDSLNTASKSKEDVYARRAERAGSRLAVDAALNGNDEAVASTDRSTSSQDFNLDA